MGYPTDLLDTITAMALNSFTRGGSRLAPGMVAGARHALAQAGLRTRTPAIVECVRSENTKDGDSGAGTTSKKSIAGLGCEVQEGSGYHVHDHLAIPDKGKIGSYRDSNRYQPGLPILAAYARLEWSSSH